MKYLRKFVLIALIGLWTSNSYAMNPIRTCLLALYRFATMPITEQVFKKGKDQVIVFNLSGLGINQHAFLKDIKPTFEGLEPDLYVLKEAQVKFLLEKFPHEKARLTAFELDYWYGRKDLSAVRDLIDSLGRDSREAFERIQPTRFRRFSKFQIEKRGEDDYAIREVDERSFSQSYLSDEEDVRKRERVFQRSSETFRNHPLVRQLLMRIFETIRKQNGGNLKKIEVTVHQMSILASNGGTATNSPEGIHKDGYDFIVSALVVERNNVSGGQSIIFQGDPGNKIYSTVLKEGEGILQSDRDTNLLHVATPIRQKDGTKPAKRNIIGLDITVLE